MAELRVPSSLDDIDAAWVETALNQSPRTRPARLAIDRIEIEPVGAGVAFLGTLARVTPNYAQGAGPGSIIVKLPPANEGALTVGRLLNAWVREARFYSELVPHLDADVPVPRSWATAIDGERAAIVIDDLHPAFTPDQVVGATRHQAHAAVEALARFHAPWWGSPRTGPAAWMPGVDGPGAGVGLASSMAANIDTFDARFGDRLPAESMGWTRAFIDHVPRWLHDQAQSAMTVAHADYRLGNLLFGPEPDGAVHIVDWQMAMITAGATDLSFFISTGMTIDDRRRHEAELVATYLSTLEAAGVASGQLGAVERQYRESLLWWMAMLSNNLANIETPDANSAALFDAMLLRLHTAAVDHDLGRVIAELNA